MVKKEDIKKIYQLKKDFRRTKEIVSRLIPITQFVQYRRSVFCPFHNDVKKPSAKIYFDEDYERLWCFACNRQFTSYHYIKDILLIHPVDYLLKFYDLNTLLRFYNEIEITEELDIKKIEKVKTISEKYPENLEKFIDCVYDLEEV